MLDNRSKVVLKNLVKECENGSYKILDTSELSDFLPNKMKVDTELLSQIIKHLEIGGYINVKYSDSNQYCLCPSPFGRQFIESEDYQDRNKKNLKSISVKLLVFVIIFAFFGAFMGTLFYNLLF